MAETADIADAAKVVDIAAVEPVVMTVVAEEVVVAPDFHIPSSFPHTLHE